EAQGRQTPQAEPAGYDTIAALGDPRIRLLIDISMLMPAPPVSYLERLERGGLESGLIARIRDEWRDPATHGAVMAAIGSVPPPLMSLYMDMIVRFGRSAATDLRPVLGLTSGIHLKFWDLDDADGRISSPVRDVGDELAAAGFTGTLTSEWGGHAWLDDDATEVTRAHLELARANLER
ncbi:MAG TPA: restriction endonuclease subunit R, partial [Pseudolysinimonas sp.]